MDSNRLAESLRPHYSRFLRDDRVLLTGHSHQAWPDVAEEGILEAFSDAAEHVDDKWALAAQKADVIRAYIAEWTGGEPASVALAQNTHELVFRFLSALDLTRRHIVCTAGEFHSMRRQLMRLAEDGLEVTEVPCEPLSTLGQRLAEAIRPDTAALMASTVLFETCAQVPGLEQAQARAFDVGAEVLFDAYHEFGVKPMWASDSRAFVVGGGYKYAQWGEGVCFMRVPKDTSLRPRFTGWFSDFSNLADGASVRYGKTPGDRFAGSTYDPVSHYRAARVIEFFREQSLSQKALAASYQWQTDRLRELLRDSPYNHHIVTPSKSGGFIAVEIEGATDVAKAMRKHGVFVDARGSRLRFGPAPYTTDEELARGVTTFKKVLR